MGAPAGPQPGEGSGRSDRPVHVPDPGSGYEVRWVVRRGLRGGRRADRAHASARASGERARRALASHRGGSVWTKASFTANDISSPPWASTSSITTGIGLTRPDDSFPRQSTRPHHRSRILPGRGYTDRLSSIDLSASIPRQRSRTRFTGGTGPPPDDRLIRGRV